MPAWRTQALGQTQMLVDGHAAIVAIASTDGWDNEYLTRAGVYLLEVFAIDHVRGYVGVATLTVTRLYVSCIATFLKKTSV